MELVRISQGAVYSYRGADAWVVGVKVVGTAGNLAKYGLARMKYEKGEPRFWDFSETDKETAQNCG